MPDNRKKIITGTQMLQKRPSLFFMALCCALCLGFFLPSIVGASFLRKPPNNLGLQAYWSFNEGAGTKAGDFSGNSNAGTLTNMANPGTSTSGWGNGKFGNGLNFDGTNDYVTVPDASSLDVTGNVTISVWVKPTNFSGGPEVINKASNSYELEIEADGKVILAKYGVAVMVRSSSALTANVWSHIVAVRSGSTSYMYFNGVDVSDNSSRSDQTFAANASAVTIGAASGGGSYRYLGSMDDIRIYNRALSATEITNLYTGSAAGKFILSQVASQNSRITSGLIGLWSFDNADVNFGVSPPVITDRSSTANNGLLVSADEGSAQVTGRILKGVTLDGVGDYVHMTNSSVYNFGSSDFTVSWWENRAENTNGQAAVVRGGDSPWLPYLLGYADGGANLLVYMSSGSGWDVANGQSLGPVTLNVWNHFTVTRNGTTFTGYKNGVKESTWESSDALRSMVGVASEKELFLGNYNGTYYHGSLDDVRIYNRGFSQAQVINLYATGGGITKMNVSQNSKNTTNLIGLWSFDGPDMVAGTTAYDKSGSAYDGTLTGMTASNAAIGKIGQALQFDGSDDYVSLPNLDRNTLSLCSWVNMIGGTSQVIVKSLADGGWGFYIGSNNTLRFTKVGTGEVASTGTVSGGWHHICVTYNGSNAKFYIDGALDSSPAFSQTFNSSAGLYGLGGLDSAGSTVNGRLDEVRLYSSVLTLGNVTTLYNAGN